jgi:CubicO group peptidase (beta-lactamase class C family)
MDDRSVYMRMTGTRAAAVILCLILSCWGYAGQIVVHAPQDVGMSAEKLGRVRVAVQGLVDEEKIAGASVLVARKGKVVFFETFGMMDKEADKPVGEDTIFRFYSMTKPVTSVAVMMLYEQGKIKLDDTVSKYAGPFKDLKVYDESGTPVEPRREMTVRDLLRHTSGLTYGFFGDTAVDRMYRESGVLDRETSLDDMVDKLGKIPLLYQPGTRWHYSVSTDVLGHLVETVSGESLDVFFERRIFVPLGMEDTGFLVPQDKVDRFAVCYGPVPGKGLRVSDDPRKSEFLEKPGLLSGGGGLVSTVGDYLRFCRMLLNRGELDGTRLLRAETVEMMTKNQLPDSVSWNGQGFGLGFSVQVTEGQYGAGEYGWGGAASTHFWIHPKHELIVIALSQLMPYSNQLQDVVKPPVYESIVSTGLKGAYPEVNMSGE